MPAGPAMPLFRFCGSTWVHAGTWHPCSWPPIALGSSCSTFWPPCSQPWPRRACASPRSGGRSLSGRVPPSCRSWRTGVWGKARGPKMSATA
uniref:Uncharacterized protein n=1 Tax=Ixodes ricinus TaxID=34613 RepID=A0A147BPN0_IXORI